MNKILILIMISLVLLLACDRFKHDYQQLVTISQKEFEEIFVQQANAYLKNNNITSLMEFYSDNYLNSGMTKEDIKSYFLSKVWTDSVSLEIARNIDTKQSSYTIRLKDELISVDTTWTDHLQKVNNKWLWYGDRQGEVEVNKQVVLVQAFTNLRCQNCPQSEAKLKEIYLANPHNYIILKYHLGAGDSLAGAYSHFSEERTYYNQNNPPVAVFQGQNVLVGASESVLNAYESVSNNLLSQEAQLDIEIDSYTVSAYYVSANINIDFKDVNQENLYLYYAVYEEETDAVNTYSNLKASNVVRARGRQTLIPGETSVSFSLDSPKYIANDTFLVVWIQKIVDISAHNQETDKIYNAVKQKLY